MANVLNPSRALAMMDGLERTAKLAGSFLDVSMVIARREDPTLVSAGTDGLDISVTFQCAGNIHL